MHETQSEIWHILKDDRPFDAPGFDRKLRRLVERKPTLRRRPSRD
jgi:hypothetical protein